MQPNRIITLFISFLLISSISLFSSIQAQNLSIEQRIKKIISTIPGEIGLSALHIESGQRVEINAQKRFPMASTSKLPMVLHCLSLVDQGLLNFDQKEIFTPYDLRRGRSKIALHQPYSLKELIRLSIEKSDNTTTDKIFKMIGKGPAITTWIQKKGIDGMSIDRSTLKFLADYSGIILKDEDRCTVEQYNHHLKLVSKKNRLKAKKEFYNDLRDTTTPRAMVELLHQMHLGKLVSQTSTNFLLECMLKCKWGDQRIKRFIPKAIPFWHKTGRIDGMNSDVGIMKLPNNKGHVALALYSNRSTAREAKRDEAFARIGKALFTFFS